MEEQSEKDKLLEAEAQERIKKDEELNNIKEQIGDYGDVEAFSGSKGGQKIIKTMENDILDGLILITTKYKTVGHIELIALCASLENKIDLLRRMTQAKGKKEEAVKDFDKRLKELFGA